MSRILTLSFALTALCATASAADSAHFSVIFGGQNIGHVYADTTANRTTIDYNVKNNGRGPTMAETITFGPDGLPTDWTISGTTTFGSKVNETFKREKSRAAWLDSTGKGQASPKQPAIYVAQSGSPWSLQVYVRALLKQPNMTPSKCKASPARSASPGTSSPASRPTRT